MSSPAAITATFSDFRLVKTRKLAQLVFEVPIEEADRALSVLGGLPRSDAERWCGIARLNSVRQTESGPQSATPQPSLPPTPAAEREGADKPRRAFHELPRSAQAAMLCENPVFQRWLIGRNRAATVYGGDAVGIADQLLKRELGITSKREMTDPVIASAFDALHARFREENGMVAEERG